MICFAFETRAVTEDDGDEDDNDAPEKKEIKQGEHTAHYRKPRTTDSSLPPKKKRKESNRRVRDLNLRTGIPPTLPPKTTRRRRLFTNNNISNLGQQRRQGICDGDANES